MARPYLVLAAVAISQSLCGCGEDELQQQRQRAELAERDSRALRAQLATAQQRVQQAEADVTIERRQTAALRAVAETVQTLALRVEAPIYRDSGSTDRVLQIVTAADLRSGGVSVARLHARGAVQGSTPTLVFEMTAEPGRAVSLSSLARIDTLRVRLRDALASGGAQVDPGRTARVDLIVNGVAAGSTEAAMSQDVDEEGYDTVQVASLFAALESNFRAGLARQVQGGF